MRTLKIYLFLVLLIPACSPTSMAVVAEPEPISTPTQDPTSEPTLTPTITPTPDKIELEDFRYEILSEKNNPEDDWPLPIETEAGWIFKNRYGPEVKIYDVEKGEILNKLKLRMPGDKQYEISMSKGAILCLYISDLNSCEQFLFSPDVGNKGSPIACSRGLRFSSEEESLGWTHCYWHQSAIQLDIRMYMGDIIEKNIHTSKGWCVDPKNIPSIASWVDMPKELVKDGYILPNGDIVEWTEDNCPFFEVIEITQ